MEIECLMYDDLFIKIVEGSAHSAALEISHREWVYWSWEGSWSCMVTRLWHSNSAEATVDIRAATHFADTAKKPYNSCLSVHRDDGAVLQESSFLQSGELLPNQDHKQPALNKRDLMLNVTRARRSKTSTMAERKK